MQDLINSLQRLPHLKGVITDFLIKLGLRRERAGMPGNLYNGEQMDKLTKESSLKELFNVLSEAGETKLGFYTVQYLNACKKLYKVCVMKNLDPEYQKYIDNYEHYFNILFTAGYINETTKAHIILAHYSDLMGESGRSLFLSDCQGLESVHSALRRSPHRRHRR